MSKLTPKERKFAELCVELGNQSEAYRQAYDVSNRDADWIKVKASQLAKKDNISLTIADLKKQEANKHGVTREWLVEKYMNIIGIHEDLANLLKSDKLDQKEKEKIYAAANSGLLRGSDATAAMTALAKMLGLNEPDKEEKQIKVEIEIKRNRVD